MRFVHPLFCAGLLAGVLLLAGCGAEGSTPTATPIAPTVAPTQAAPTPTLAVPTPTTVQLETPASVGEPPTLVPNDMVKPGPEKAVALARAALAARLNADPATITLVRTTPTEWPNSAIGCPEPGKAYAQMVTPGYIVELAQGETHYIYHASAFGDLATCAEATP